MHSQGFERLIKKMDEIAGKTDEKIIMQIGSTKYKPKNAEYFDYIEDHKKIQELNRKARVVVCHGGAGVIITASAQKSSVIAVPRLKKYDEHINDHQLELVNALEKKGKISVVYDIDQLESALRNSILKTNKEADEEKTLVRELREYLRKIDN